MKRHVKQKGISIEKGVSIEKYARVNIGWEGRTGRPPPSRHTPPMISGLAAIIARGIPAAL